MLSWKPTALVLALGAAQVAPTATKAAEFLLIPGTTSLAMLGTLTPSDVAEFERQLEKGVTEVILSSPGGDLDTAWEIGEAITRNGIATRLVEDTECASACSILFLHGSSRRMSNEAKLGVHLPYFSGSNDQVAGVCASLDAFLAERFPTVPAATLHLERPELFEFNASHILLETRAAAEQIIELLRSGADFADLANAYSVGPSGERGGELGWFGKDMMVSSFEEATFQLNVGEFTSAPVQTQFGWHVIQLNDVRPLGSVGLSRSDALGVDCLTAAYQVGAFEFLRISELIQSAGGSWQLLRLIVTTRSQDMYWMDHDEALAFGVLSN